MQLLIKEEQNQVDLDLKLKELLEEILERLLHEEGFSQEFIDVAEVSMILTDDQRIAVLNESYRGIAEPTDVLSFPMLADDEDLDDLPGEFLLGDIVISVPRALEQAQKYGHSFLREMAFLGVHGMLHLLGYDHQLEADSLQMRAKEKNILELAGLAKGYDEDGKTQV